MRVFASNDVIDIVQIDEHGDVRLVIQQIGHRDGIKITPDNDVVICVAHRLLDRLPHLWIRTIRDRLIAEHLGQSIHSHGPQGSDKIPWLVFPPMYGFDRSDEIESFAAILE
jgi:hypothetical protein